MNSALSIAAAVEDLASAPQAARDDGWHAQLTLRFAAQAARTALVERRHCGPLRVQRPLYPEGPAVGHAVIVHPPGGVAGGDALAIDVHVGARAHALLTTPGATKWYKAHGRRASQSVTLTLARDARLDWLPQNNILFDGADVATDFTLTLADGARALGWDATQLGRQAAGARWTSGTLRQRGRILGPDGRLLWCERTMLDAAGALRDARQGLAGHAVFGLLWAVGPACTAELAEAVAAHLPFGPDVRAGATCMPGNVLLIRAVAASMEALQATLIDCWTRLRPAVLGVQAAPLRLWAT